MWYEEFLDQSLLTQDAGFADEETFFRKSTVLTDTDNPAASSDAIIPVRSDKRGMRLLRSPESHTLIAGVSGAGKTRRVLIPAICAAMTSGSVRSEVPRRRRPSLFIFDVKGEIYDHTINLARAQGYTVVNIDLQHPEQSDGYDVLALASECYASGDVSGAEQALAALGSAISPLPTAVGSKQDPFWARCSQSCISGVGLFLLAASKKRVTFPQLLDKILEVIRDDTVAHNFIEYVGEKLGTDCTAYRCLMAALSGSERQLQNVANSISSDVSEFFKMDAIEKVMSKPMSAAFNSLSKDPTVIYFKTSEVNSALYGFGQMVFRQLSQRLVTEAGSSHLPRPFLFFLDEVCNGQRIENLDTMMAMCRSKWIRLILCVQSLKQLDAVYGERADIIRSNCQNLIVLRTSDPGTWDLVSRLAGPDIRGRTLVPSHVLAHLKTGQALILSGSDQPYMAQLCDFTELPWFRLSREKAPPSELPRSPIRLPGA